MKYLIKNINMENRKSRFFKRSIFVGGKRLRAGNTAIVNGDELAQVNKFVAYPGDVWGRMHQIYAEPQEENISVESPIVKKNDNLLIVPEIKITKIREELNEEVIPKASEDTPVIIEDIAEEPVELLDIVDPEAMLADVEAEEIPIDEPAPDPELVPEAKTKGKGRRNKKVAEASPDIDVQLDAEAIEAEEPKKKPTGKKKNSRKDK